MKLNMEEEECFGVVKVNIAMVVLLGVGFSAVAVGTWSAILWWEEGCCDCEGRGEVAGAACFWLYVALCCFPL